MTKTRPQRRQRHGSAWYWKQTDSWYYSPKGTKKRVPLFDTDGKRIRGQGNKQVANLALARAKLAKPFGDFVFAAIHTGLRPFCELARLTALGADCGQD